MPNAPGLRALVCAFAMLCAAQAHAQCPDGTPRPCRTDAPKRITVALNDNTWIVVPFDNTARNAEVEWLRDGSVSVLSQEFAQWTDLRVIDEKRVADFVREMPSANTQKLSLGDGLAVAKRAGAGKLVMGDILKVGARTTISAYVYNVQTGERVSAVKQVAAVADSILPVYSQLAREIIGAAPAVNARGASTTNLGAYQAYVAGVRALNKFDVSEGRQQLERAIQLDSTFALAHYKLAIAIAADEADAAKRNQSSANVFDDRGGAARDSLRALHAAAASRHAATLPPRDRGLIAGLLADTRRDLGTACASYAGVVRADSSDVEALYALGDCLLRDNVVEFANGDATRPRFRGNWNTSLRVLRRVLAIDPTYHLAFNDILAMLSAPGRVGCVPPANGQCIADMRSMLAVMRDRDAARAALATKWYSSAIRLNGDSLLMIPSLLATTNIATGLSPIEEGSTTRKPNLEQALAAAREWVDAGPTEMVARRALGAILLRLGRSAEADSQLAIADRTIGRVEPSIVALRIEAALKLGRIVEASRLLDTGFTRFPTGIGRVQLAPIAVVFGRASIQDSMFIASTRATFDAMRSSIGSDSAFQAAMQGVLGYLRVAPLVVLGAPPPNAVAMEEQRFKMMSGGCDANCIAQASAILKFGFRLPRTTWPAITDTMVRTDPGLGPAAAMARNDTAALRVAALRLDSLSRAQVVMFAPDNGSALVAAEAFLVLGDTARAEVAVRRSLDQLMASTPLMNAFMGNTVVSSWFWPRAMLLRADLAAARKQTDEARTWYTRFIDLWVKADPQFKPIVDRARAARAALPTR